MARAPVLLYLHIPKTAGSSLSSIIYDQYHDPTGSREEDGMFCWGVYYFPGKLGFFHRSDTDLPDNVVRTICRSDVRAVVGHFSFGLHTLMNRPTTYMTMLRHPVDRVSSLYYHLKEWGPRKPELLSKAPESGFGREWIRVLQADISLDDFVRDYTLPELDNDQTRRVAGEKPEFGVCSRVLLDRAKSNIERFFSIIGVAERFDESVQVASDLLDWSAETADYRENVNTLRAPASSISPETREAILERNALDLELYAFANEWLDDHL
jgi:hypothetical protein